MQQEMVETQVKRQPKCQSGNKTEITEACTTHNIFNSDQSCDMLYNDRQKDHNLHQMKMYRNSEKRKAVFDLTEISNDFTSL